MSGKTMKTAVRALRRNKTRSALTVLGIVIGIAAVIAMMEIGKGSSRAIERTIASMGANNLMITPGTASSGGVTFGGGSAQTLTAEDAEAIGRECPGVLYSAPVERARTQVIYQDRNWVPTFIFGTTPEYLDVRDWRELAEGEMFTDADVRSSARVAVVGQTIVRELFRGRSPVGRDIRIQNTAFRVVGVLSPKGANAFGWDQDDIIIAPLTTIQFRVAGSTGNSPTGQAAASGSTSSQTTSGASRDQVFPGSASVYPPASGNLLTGGPTAARFMTVDQVLVAARSPDQVRPAIQQITQLLRERHRLRPGEPDDFAIRDMTESASSLAATTSMMTNLLLAVALISLVVGGVGIMNIMLVSVTERTREIGLRMAVGARARDILWQFLVEATLLCVIGGIVGLALGRGTALLVRELLGWPVEMSVEAIVASILVSGIVGVVFGFYPAFKASRLDPIEALRYE
jgi:ABC-type antimicrobial peptide transport system permease subunit